MINSIDAVDIITVSKDSISSYDIKLCDEIYLIYTFVKMMLHVLKCPSHIHFLEKNNL